jgi:hypothetical protein
VTLRVTTATGGINGSVGSEAIILGLVVATALAFDFTNGFQLRRSRREP